jgi:hypothetical protein
LFHCAWILQEYVLSAKDAGILYCSDDQISVLPLQSFLKYYAPSAHVMRVLDFARGVATKLGTMVPTLIMTT